MKKLLLPIVLLLIGTGAGIGAGIFLKEEPEEDLEMSSEHPCGDPTEVAELPEPVALETTTEFAKLSNQFVVPIVKDGKINAMVVLSLSIEVVEGNKAVVFATEPKLRDAFLQVLFNHANIDGFSGNFTTSSNMRILREELLRAADGVLGANAIDVLILDIVRQDN